MGVLNILSLIFIIFLFPHHQVIVRIIIVILNIQSIRIVCEVIEVIKVVVSWVNTVSFVMNGLTIGAIVVLLYRGFLWLCLLISNNFDVSFIDDLVVSNRLGIWNRYRNLSDNRYSLYIGGWNWYSSSNGYSLVNWILNMMDIILLIILLNYGLSYDLLSWNLNGLCSGHIVYFNRFSYRI